MPNNPLDDLVKQILQQLPQGVAHLRDDLRRNLHAGLEAGLKKLDLVTRQEFEIQRQLLERAQQQLKDLEAKLAALETNLDNKTKH